MVKQVAEQPVEITQQIADAIVKMSDGYVKMKNSGLTDKALVLLISESSGVCKRDVQFVLNGIHNLRFHYLKSYAKPKK